MFDVLDSALFLAKKGKICLRDVLNGDMNFSSVRLAVLSACQTGITDFQSAPDEVIGMTSGFLQAGVCGVISTLWRVDDLPTALLLIRFYHYHVKEKLSPSMALNQAQLWLRKAKGKDLASVFEQYADLKNPDIYLAMRYFRSRQDYVCFDHPYFWAGFVFSGV